MLGSDGRPVQMSGDAALVQRAALCLRARRGKFAYDPELGSLLYTLSPGADADHVRALARQALRRLPVLVQDASCSRTDPLLVWVTVRAGQIQEKLEVRPHDAIS